MDIILYLTELLQTNKTVGIVGLGTLYKKKIPGKYDVNKHVFIPPNYQLAFTTEIVENKLLADFIAQKRNISTESAFFYIEEFAAQTQTKLSDKQEVSLHPLGKLTLTHNELNFLPDAESNFNTTYFGLPELTDTVSTTKPIVAHEVKVDAESTTQQEMVDENVEVEKTKLSFGIKFLIVILIITVLSAIVYFINPKFFNTYFQSNFEGKQDKKVLVAKDSSKSDSSVKKLDSITPANTNIKDTIRVDSTKITLYEVIASAEKSQDRIDNFIKLMTKKGIKAKALPKAPGKTMIKISVGTFTDFNLAKKHQDSLRIKLNNPEIYIQQIKPKK